LGLLAMCSATMLLYMGNRKEPKCEPVATIIPLSANRTEVAAPLTSLLPTESSAEQVDFSHFLVFGVGSRRGPIRAAGVRACPACRQDCKFNLMLDYHYAHLYFFFGSVTRWKFVEVCERCANAWIVPTREIENARSLARDRIHFMHRWGCVIFLL